jgi:hypothetical protein
MHSTHKENSVFKTTPKKLIGLGIATVVLATAGVSWAYWTTSGSGTGSASTGTSEAVTVAQLGTITGLVPGGPAADVDFSITNPASFNQYIATVAVSKVSVSGPNITVGTPCTVDDFTLTQPDDIEADLTPGTHQYSPSGATLKLDNTSSNQDGCKGATISLAFAAS